jgi:hypothetical protein
MKQIIWAAAFLTFLAVPASAQQTNSQQRTQQSKGTGSHDSSPRKAQPAVVAACNDLETTGSFVDKLYDEKGDPIFDLVDTTGTHYGPPSAEGPDSVWDGLIDCANQTHSESQRAEALRVAAMWEQWRAARLAQQYREERPVHPASCDNLDQLRARVKAVTDEEPSSATTHPMQDYDSTLEALRKCMSESVHASKGKPDERYWSAVTLLSLELWEAKRARALFEQAYLNTADYAKAQTEYDARQKGGAEQNEKIGTHQPAGKTASQCDQIITVAGLTPKGLALYIPPEGQRFMAKNSKNYPRMCLVQDATKFTPGVPDYLLVWAYSENAFAGFQPVQQVTTAPVSGSGTVTNLSGGMWHFTYTGTETEINTVEAPYVIQSRSLYLRAYDERGNLVSQHSIATSNMAGGDTSYAAGYNAGALISALWNNPSHLIKSVLKDVQKDSVKFTRK